MASAPRFTPRSLTFLRALKRHNDREWFRARRDEYETHVRGPLVAIIERLAADFRSFAPEMVADPKVSTYRIYRDTRFSADKSPLKTHVAGIFPDRRLGKGAGAALYFHVGPDEMWIGGGLYHPDTPKLHAVREHLAGNFSRFRTIVRAPAFRRTFQDLEGDRMQRVPRGFPADHAAAEYLKLRDFLVGVDHPVPFATDPRFYRTLVATFRQAIPFVRFINEALVTTKERQAFWENVDILQSARGPTPARSRR
ncbi:MAG: DUF2461 domain-containing protein [Acidobacteriota bacterium]|nr:DUF2461 domain-containing protein [Acidobacteriota bacterium]